jgi:hypothetical protein
VHLVIVLEPGIERGHDGGRASAMPLDSGLRTGVKHGTRRIAWAKAMVSSAVNSGRAPRGRSRGPLAVGFVKTGLHERG